MFNLNPARQREARTAEAVWYVRIESFARCVKPYLLGSFRRKRRAPVRTNGHSVFTATQPIGHAGFRFNYS
jgi:hypothetical protein